MNDFHTASAAAVDGFDDNREAVFFSKSTHLFHTADDAVRTGDHRDTGQFGLRAGIDLITEHDQVFQPRPDKDEAFFSAAFGQLAIFR